MNRIKSLFSFLYIALAIMICPLCAGAQSITAPTGTSTSVKLLGQTYIEIGNHVKKAQSIDNIGTISEKIATKYEGQVDITVKLNNNDRKYITKCVMYNFKQMLSCSFLKEGLDPNDPEVAQYLNKTLEDYSKTIEKKLAGAKTVGDAITILETALD